MKKTFIISFAFIISLLFISQQLFAQRYYRNNSRIYNDPYDLNLTQKQLEKMDKLELDLEKSLSPLFSKLRTNYLKLDELELQRSPDHNKIDKVWEEIYTLEEEIERKEIAHEKNISGLLTEDQRALFDSYYGYGMETGRGYYGRGQGGMGQGYYGRGVGYGAGYGRNYLGRGRGLGTLGQGYYGIGRGNGAGYGRNYLGRGQGYYGRGQGVARGASRFNRGNYRYDSRVRYGRGPCGAGLGRYSWDYGRGRWD